MYILYSNGNNYEAHYKAVLDQTSTIVQGEKAQTFSPELK